MSEHTPGPWLIVGKADPEIHGSDGIRITNQVRSGAGDDENDGMANARLIAAAPELLEACMNTIEYLSRRADGESADGESTELWAIVAAAASRATGENIE